MIRFAQEAARRSGSTRDPAPAGPLMPAETPVGRLERVGEEVAEAAAHIDAATCRFLARLRDFDRLFQESGGSLGFASCAAWLSWRIGVTPGTAREKVRVARALGELPKVEEAMARGRLSYSQVRSITRVATAENEETLLGFAEHATAAQLETLVRGWRGLDRQAEAERDRKRHERRSLSVRPTQDGSWEVRGRLEPEVGVLFRKALELVSEAMYRRQRGEGGAKRASSGRGRPRQAQQWADAVGIVAETLLRLGLGGESGCADACAAGEGAADEGGSVGREGDLPTTLGRGDRYQVVVRVDARTLFCDDENGECVLADGGAHISAETLRRIGCDAGFVAVLEDEEGRVRNVGRRRRVPTTAQRRALAHRDRQCRFPGCRNDRFLVPHHVIDWVEGGPTDLDNLGLLCRIHHRAVHEGGYRMEGSATDGFVFRSPGGRVIPEVPERPAVPDDPLGALRRDNRRRGLDIDAWTATSAWTGEPFDAAWGLGLLWQAGRAGG